MKKKLVFFITVLMIIAMLPLQICAKDNIAGKYGALVCWQGEEGSEEYFSCEGEYLELYADGTGEILFSGEVYAITWSLEGDSLSFEDNEGYQGLGYYEDGSIQCEYAGYGILYANEETAGRIAENSAPVAISETVESGEAVVKEQIFFTADNSADTGDYLILNSDGTGVMTLSGCAYSHTWSFVGDKLVIKDHTGHEMTGSFRDNLLEASYGDIEYTWVEDDGVPPILSFAPGNWYAGLPNVYDQADILTDAEEDELMSKAEAISEQYKCKVYIITADDMNNYCMARNIETFSEELRAAYQLGYGEGQEMVLLVLSMADRDYDFMAHGEYGNVSFTDHGKAVVKEEFLDDFGNNSWYDGFMAYLNGCERLLELSADGKPYDVGSGPLGKTERLVFFVLRIFFSVALGIIVSVIAGFVLKNRMQPVRESDSAYMYVPKGGFEITFRKDRYVRTSETRVYDPPSKSSGGSSGGTSRSSSGSSHSSGKF